MLRNTSAALRKARRSLAAAAAAAALIAAPAARAQQVDPPQDFTVTVPQQPVEWRVGPSFGFETGGVGGQEFTAAKLRVDAERSMGLLAPGTPLALVVSLAAFHPSGSYAFGIPGIYGMQGFTVSWDANVLELVVSARATRAISPRFSLFGDAGLGVDHVFARATLPPEATQYGIRPAVGDGTGGLVRLAGGGVFAVTPQLHVVAEVIGIQLRFGEAADTGFGMLLSISHLL